MTNASTESFFNRSLADVDPEIFGAIGKELGRQRHEIELIASENIVSRAVLEAQGSIMTNKYAEGYPGKRYYGGCQFVDIAEELAIERAKKLFGVNFANVQPNSGSQMNQAVFLALLQPGDTFMGLDLNSGGHLTHGSPVNMSGKWFNVVSYGVREGDNLLDMDDVARKAEQHKPKLIIAGGQHPSPFPHCHVATTTTHKSLRGPRGGVILTNEEDLAKKFNSAVFPGLQGGPLMHIIAAKAVAFGEALQPEFKEYAAQVVKNARALAETLMSGGLDVVSGGTDNHLMLVDLRKKNATGKRAEAALGRAYVTCNKNGIPFDPEKPFVTSGVRLGAPAGTTRGFKEAEFREIGNLIVEVLDGLKVANSDEGNAAVEAAVRGKVVNLTDRFPMYDYMG
jgi:glycine hydroxymethyltransferase